MKLASHSLASNTAYQDLHVMPSLLVPTSQEEAENHPLATGIIYQIDSVNRTLHRSGLAQKTQLTGLNGTQERNDRSRPSDPAKPKLDIDMDDLQFRSLVLETQVLATVNFIKWRWDLINDIIEGPLLNPKRLEEVMKASKFLKRLTGFYRPLKYRFSEARNTKPNQRYVRTGCALIKTLLQNPEGIAYLTESKLLRQLAECLAQLDRVCPSLRLWLGQY